jgi:hypothetical protein
LTIFLQIVQFAELLVILYTSYPAVSFAEEATYQDRYMIPTKKR